MQNQIIQVCLLQGTEISVLLCVSKRIFTTTSLKVILKSLLNSPVGQIIFWSCVHKLSVKESDVWSGEIYLQFAFSLLVAGLD